MLNDRLLDAHTLQVADFDGDGRPDIYVGEMGRGDWTKPHPPRQLLYLSRGDHMEQHVIDTGIGTHEAQGHRAGRQSRHHQQALPLAPGYRAEAAVGG